MTKLLLSVHVLAAILTIGPVAVVASLFPRYAREALDGTGDADPGVVRVLHRVTRVYAVLGVLVPAFGFATAASLGVLGDVWLLVSIALTAAAAALLVGSIVPGQERLLRVVVAPGEPPASWRSEVVRLGMRTGIFNLLWAIVVVLMIVRPGSTTGA
jgi:hypothetical protein